MSAAAEAASLFVTSHYRRPLPHTGTGTEKARALYPPWDAARGTLLKLLNLRALRIWSGSRTLPSGWGGGQQVYRGSRTTEKRRRRLKKVSIKKAPAVRTEQAAVSELTSDP